MFLNIFTAHEIVTLGSYLNYFRVPIAVELNALTFRI